MKKLSLLFFFALSVVISVSCDSESKLIYPPENAVNRVMDFYLFDDGKTFLYLNSNTNRKYDFGELVLMQFDDEGDPVFKDSLLVPSISGKMAVSSDEKSVYVTTRDKSGVVKAKISGKTGSYKVEYEEGTKGDYPEILKTEKEPYALILTPDQSKLLVTHVLNGELSVIDIKKWEVTNTEKLKYGVTEILYDENSKYYLTSHKSSGKISLIEAKETIDGEFVVAVKEMPIDLPTKGYDVRSMKHSGDGTLLYAAFQNTAYEDSYTYTYDEDTAPQLVTLKLENKSLKTMNILALSGSLGEVAVFNYNTESEKEKSEETESKIKKDATETETTGETTLEEDGGTEETGDTDSADTSAAPEETGDTDSADSSAEPEETGDTGDTDTSAASEETGETQTVGRNGDLIFVSIPEDEKVVMIDSARNGIRDEISYKDDKKECNPYQLYTKNLGNTDGYLFVSCFQNDRVYIYKIDLMAQQIIKKIGVLE